MRTPYHLRTQTASINAATRNQTTAAVTYAARTGLSAVPCTVQPDNSSEAVEYMRNTTGRRRSTIALPVTYGGVDVVVSQDDRIVVGSTTYKVMGPGMNAAGQNANLVVPVYEES